MVAVSYGPLAVSLIAWWAGGASDTAVLAGRGPPWHYGRLGSSPLRPCRISSTTG